MPRESASTTVKILDIAERLAQQRGFNGFSYADIAAELGVSKASLHYHYPSKAALGRALIVRYRAAFDGALEAIDAAVHTAPERLERYVALYDDVMQQDRMCLCGMLAAEYATLPSPMQTQLRRFFEANERWLTGVFERGREAGELAFRDEPRERARIVLAALEGAMLIARSYQDGRRFRAAADRLLANLRDGRRASRPPRAPERSAGAPRHSRMAAEKTTTTAGTEQKS